ncbi:galactose-specific lectin nattectin-like [Plectropomus leopardus]|uniref:galactose-specific lectin nattectin-like n=1 Tax=Plectropomus leopardus TaxID=160734 RepID=UPI001C4D0244|nr:galactose-specific lectin nattectin-like [Plectropomus leopardus]
MLTVTLLLCAMVALTGAAAVPEPGPVEDTELVVQEGEHHIVERATSCPGGWESYNGRCFHYVPTPMSWANAEKYCLNFGGNLASVHDFNEQHVIQSMILRLTHSYPHTWLGGYDATQEGTWFWSDGTPFRFNYWDQGQPDNYGTSHCLIMNFGGPKKFDDQRCYESKPFVCAKKL